MPNIYVVITRERDGDGYRVSLRDISQATRPLMQSAKVRTPSDARREAERLFGPLEWTTDHGLQSYVVEAAMLSAGGKPYKRD